MDWTVDWIVDWALLIEMSYLAISWFAAWRMFKLGGPIHSQGKSPDCYQNIIIMELVGN